VDEITIEKFRVLLPNILQCITAALTSHQEQEAQKALTTFINLIETQPQFFRQDSLPSVTSTMFAIAREVTYTEEIHQSALEVLLTLCETKSKMMRIIPTFIPAMLHFILSWISTVEDYAGWQEFQDNDDSDNNKFAEEALDRFCNAISGRHIVSILFGLINSLIISTDWKQRYCAVMAISICAEGCKKQLMPHVSELVDKISPLANDLHPRVRWAVVNCFGQMCTDLTPLITVHHGTRVLDILIKGMQDPVMRVQARSISASINFCEESTQVAITTILPILSSELRRLLSSSSPIIQELVLTVLSTIVESVGDKFLPFYEQFIPQIKGIIVTAAEEKYQLLRAKAMDCFSLIGCAVGRERFFSDAIEIMSSVVSSKLITEDILGISYLESGFGRIAECLGDSFTPFLPVIIPSVITRAGSKQDIEVWNDVTKTKEGWDTITIGNRQIGIPTAQLEDRASAMQTLLSYSTQFKEMFAPYVQSVTEIALAQMTCHLHEGIRGCAYVLLPQLLLSMKCCLDKQGWSDTSQFTQLWHYYFTEGFIKNLGKEHSPEVLHMGLQAWGQCFSLMKDQSLNREQLYTFITTLKLLLDRTLAHILAIKTKEDSCDIVIDNVDGSNGVRDEECENDSDDYNESELYKIVLSDLACVNRDCLQYYQEEPYTSIWQELLLPTIEKMVQRGHLEEVRQNGIRLWNDFVECCKPINTPELLIHYLNTLLSFGTDPLSGVREAVFIGLGNSAMIFGDFFLPFLPGTLAILRDELLMGRVLQMTEKESGDSSDMVEDGEEEANREFLRVKDIATAVIGKILEFQSKHIDILEALKLFISGLPLCHSGKESDVTHARFINLLEGWNEGLMFENGTYFALKLISILVYLIKNNAIPIVSDVKFTKLLHRLIPHVSADVWALGSPDDFVIIQKYITSH